MLSGTKLLKACVLMEFHKHMGNVTVLEVGVVRLFSMVILVMQDRTVQLIFS